MVLNPEEVMRILTSRPGNVARNIYDVLGSSARRALPTIGGPVRLPDSNTRRVTSAPKQESRIRSTRQPAVSTQGSSPLGSLYDLLLQQLTSPVTVDEDELMGLIRGSIDPIYDARRSVLEGMMSQAEDRTARGRQDIESMYEALAQDYERLAPTAAQQAARYQDEIESLYGSLRSNIEGNYARVADEQRELYEQLGIEDALPGAQEAILSQGADSASVADELSAINQQRALDMANIDQSYYRQGAPLARLTGSNRSADLLQQLQEQLASLQSEISMLEGERTAGIQSGFTNALLQARQSAEAQERMRQEMLWNMLQATMQPGELTPDSFLSSLDPTTQMRVAAAFRQLERSPEVVMGRVQDPRHPVPGTFVPITDEWWLDAVDRMYESGEIDEMTRNALLTYLRLRMER